jgi:SAM-dependent methyltransferase
MASVPPVIFAPGRRIALRRRMRHLQARPDAARYLLEDMVEDVAERLAFLRHAPARALVIGDHGGQLAAHLAASGTAAVSASPEEGLDEEAPLPFSGFDLIASLGTLDTVNDLPGALIHLRSALAPGGLMIASFMAAGSLPALRQAMLEADGDRPAPRLHPMVDVRAGGQLLQRAGFADPVIDCRPLRASFRSLGGLVADLRAQGMSNCLARSGPPLGKAARHRAEQAFAAQGQDGRTVETFEILTLSGWRK